MRDCPSNSSNIQQKLPGCELDDLKVALPLTGSFHSGF